ncbi:MAG: hypothetical protein MJ239_03350 [Bacilli bacterium]|nr:hypothetical protein [Bacilli bacterium]
MKRYLSTALIGLALLGLSSCGGGASSSSTTSQVSQAKFTITVNQVEHAIISSNVSQASEGETVSLSIEVEENYEFDYFTLNDAKIEGNQFKMPGYDVTVSAIIKEGGEVLHSITCLYNEHVDFFADVEEAHKGDTITLDYYPTYGYALDYFEVNSSRIEGLSFEMPSEDVVISCHESYIAKPSDISITCTNVGREEYDATSNWFIELEEDSLHVYTIVDDHFIVDNSYTMREEGLKDNAEILLTPTKYANTKGLSVNHTIDLMINVSGFSWAKLADSDKTFIDSSLVGSNVESEVVKYDYFNKDGITGYRVDFYVSYDIWNWEEGEEKSFVICPSFRNCVNAYKNYWDFYHGFDCEEYLDCSNHPLINKDGTLARNPYHE